MKSSKKNETGQIYVFKKRKIFRIYFAAVLIKSQLLISDEIFAINVVVLA